MFSFLNPRPKQILANSPISDSLWCSVAGWPLLRGLDAEETRLLREQASVFLGGKAITGAHGLELDDEARLVIAAQCCLPLIHLGRDALDDWHEVIVYPGQFLSRSRTYESVGDYLGLVHESEDILAGQARPDGPILLSLLDCRESPWLEGWNVPIHEIAHKLDMRSGEANGCPPLHNGMDYAEWKAVFTHAFDDLARRADSWEPCPIDPYAAENPGECFAVFSEYFFELPHLLSDQYPAVYRQLCAFYRQDPARRLPRMKYRPVWAEDLPSEYRAHA
ncbi:hypothetical protein SAMN05660284_02184 [Formivibrio citricus]|uniref:Zinc-dependent peptidase n=1 Tax=Formivibrio citricus TaxID=83765 RepID=A0A1I5BJL4_9NEIS|nr:M90 family metallopeptidase [Formivibrio citricus]SFN74935.1 hypothetical protein SAMN05660284_02184 [Formivibrio citricus]